MSLIFRGGFNEQTFVTMLLGVCGGREAQGKYDLYVICVQGVSFLFCGFVEH